jgi:hypothetical protein
MILSVYIKSSHNATLSLYCGDLILLVSFVLLISLRAAETS